jgi:hypothetical protein
MDTTAVPFLSTPVSVKKARLFILYIIIVLHVLPFLSVIITELIASLLHQVRRERLLL